MANMIEKLNSQRYNALLLQTIGVGLLLPGLFVLPLQETLNIFLICITVLGLLLFAYASYRLNSLRAVIKNNPELNDALNNEFYKLCDYKSVAWGFYAMIAVAAILYIVVGYWNVPTRIILNIIIFAGIMTVKIAQLILKKN